jgi:hypothetical protein
MDWSKSTIPEAFSPTGLDTNGIPYILTKNFPNHHYKQM